MQFHPFAYLVKLNIEMSMAELIAKVSVLPNYLPPKPRAPLQIGIQTDISIKHDDVSDVETLVLKETNTRNSPAPSIGQKFDHGRPVVFVGEDDDEEILKGNSDPTVKGSGSWFKA